jgi:multidrug resistance efflux pump
MRQLNWRILFSRRAAWAFGGGIVVLTVAVLTIRSIGRGQQPQPQPRSSLTSVPEVHVINPQRRNLTSSVEQPGFVQAYEETAIYSKVSGFIKQYYVDIGQRVKKDELIVEIFVPELNEDHLQKMAQVKLDRSMVLVAESKVKTAIAQWTEAKANVDKYTADIRFWESEVKRFTKMVEQHVVSQQDLDETEKQLAASRSARDAALAAVAAREAAQASAEADLQAAHAQVDVAEADERRTAALLAYTKVTAPYDGVITVRNANTGDYVQAATGDKSSSRAAPMFVIARDDLVRIFVDVPENYSQYVAAGTKATVRADALSGLEIKATIARTSWSLTEKTRTLWAEIDLPTRNTDPQPKSIDFLAKNSDPPGKNNAIPVSSVDPPTQGVDPPPKSLDPPGKSVDPSGNEYDPPTKSDVLRPGNYVYAQVIVERHDVWMVPQATLVLTGNETYCYLLHGGKAVKAPVVPGLSDGDRVELTKMKIDGQWGKVTGNEEVIQGELGELSDGQAVKVAGKQ